MDPACTCVLRSIEVRTVRTVCASWLAGACSQRQQHACSRGLMLVRAVRAWHGWAGALHLLHQRANAYITNLLQILFRHASYSHKLVRARWAGSSPIRVSTVVWAQGKDAASAGPKLESVHVTVWMCGYTHESKQCMHASMLRTYTQLDPSCERKQSAS
jgi:hypothetical protein